MLAQYLSYEFIALFMFITMLVMMFTGQRVFGAIGFVAAASALLIWGEGSMEMPYTATWKLFKWYPMLTLPLFIYMGFMISESGIANDLFGRRRADGSDAVTTEDPPRKTCKTCGET